MIGPQRYWGQPPSSSDRWARASYFSDWNFQVLPRRGRLRADGQRGYEVRMLMTGIVFGIDDTLSSVAAVDVPGLLERLEAQKQSQAHHSDRFENEDLYWAWLSRALIELHRRTAALPPGTPIPSDDWHLRDLERLRRVAARMAAYLFIPLAQSEPT
ncbi:MAG TPA: hypothetical protein DFR83_01385 [Deltaproteobacteria bacterium]|nr:hypothetical protein [Deltaproteobacteria bacterium]